MADQPRYVDHPGMSQKPGELGGKKIIFLLASLELGGAERQALLLARYLQTEANALVSIWGIERTGRVAEICREYGLECELVPFVATGAYARDLAGMFRFIRMLRRARPDILLPYTLIPNILCGLVWKFTPTCLCIWNQRDEGFNLRNDLFYHRWAVRNISLFIANSSRGKEVLVNDFSVEPSKIEIVRNGTVLADPVHDRTWWRNYLSIHDDDFVACMVANLHKYKDHMTLIRAWRRVVDMTSEEWGHLHLVLAGRFDGTEEEIRAEISELDLENHVTLLGKVDDIAGLLGAVDIGVFSSKSEGCPNGILECMLTGIPVVATDIPGVRDVVGPTGEDWLAMFGDVEEFAMKISMLVRADANMRRNIGEAGRAHVEKMFSPRQMCELSVTILRKQLYCVNSD